MLNDSSRRRRRSDAHDARERALATRLAQLEQIVGDVRAVLATRPLEGIGAEALAEAARTLRTALRRADAAAQAIVTRCGPIEPLAGGLGATAVGGLRDAIVRVDEACTTHDLTSQRVLHLIAAVKAIERAVAPAAERGLVPEPSGMPEGRGIEAFGIDRLTARPHRV